MKFLVSGDLSNNRLLQMILFFSLIYIVLFWLTGVLLYVEKIGISPAAIASYYLGSESEFKNPISYAGLLEITHFHLFAVPMALLLVSHLTAFSGLRQEFKSLLIIVSFISGMGNVAAGWLIRYASPVFAWLKIGSFIAFQAAFLILILCSFAALRIYRYRGQS